LGGIRSMEIQRNRKVWQPPCQFFFFFSFIKLFTSMKTV
jgi:hypothetical protein